MMKETKKKQFQSHESSGYLLQTFSGLGIVCHIELIL